MCRKRTENCVYSCKSDLEATACISTQAYSTVICLSSKEATNAFIAHRLTMCQDNFSRLCSSKRKYLRLSLQPTSSIASYSNHRDCCRH